MLDLWNRLSLAVGDTLLGWLLYLPSDLVLLGLALVTASLMLAVRLFTTNQDLLRRIDHDRGMLKKLIRVARREGRRDDLRRFRLTGNQIALRKLAAEGKPLLAVLLPVAVLATWASLRVEFHPPPAATPVRVVFYAPFSAAGEVLHLVPYDGLQANNGWVQELTTSDNVPGLVDRLYAWFSRTEVKVPPPDAVAAWKLEGPPGSYRLCWRFRDLTIERDLVIGQQVYAPAWDIAAHPDIVTEVKMDEVKLFGIVPGLGPYFPAWLVGYLVLALPLVYVLKKVVGIY